MSKELRFEFAMVLGGEVGDCDVTCENAEHEEDVQEHSERMEKRLMGWEAWSEKSLQGRDY